jgi:hypothetical protein
MHWLSFAAGMFAGFAAGFALQAATLACLIARRPRNGERIVGAGFALRDAEPRQSAHE